MIEHAHNWWYCVLWAVALVWVTRFLDRVGDGKPLWAKVALDTVGVALLCAWLRWA